MTLNYYVPKMRALWVLSLCVFSCNAAAGSSAENSVKAAVVHKIAKFVTWPAGAFPTSNSPIRFCVAGDSPVLAALQSLQSRPIHGRSLLVRPAPSAAQVSNLCDVLYLGETDERQATDWMAAVADSPILTFGESSQLDGERSIVTIMIRRSKVRFAINLGASTRAGLNIGAQLLQLAALVETGPTD